MSLKAKTLRSGTYAGLAAASDLASADCYEKLNYRVRRDQDLVLEHKDTGVRYFSDFDLHGVYDAGGRDAWGADVWTKLNRALGAHGVKHAPHDEWLLRNSVEAGPNRGPQIGDGKAVTAYLPDGSVEHLTTLAAMKRFYCQHHIPWPYLD